MEGLKELLAKHKEKELTESEFEEELKKNVLPKEWIPKATFNELNDKHKNLEKQKAEIEKALEEAGKNKTSVEDLTKQISDLKNQHAEELKKKETEYENYKKDSFIDSLLNKSGVKTVKAVRGLLDLTKITKGENGEYGGLQEQIDALKKDENTSYLFADNKNDKPFFGSGSSGTGGTGNSHEANILARMGVTE